MLCLKAGSFCLSPPRSGVLTVAQPGEYGMWKLSTLLLPSTQTGHQACPTSQVCAGPAGGLHCRVEGSHGRPPLCTHALAPQGRWGRGARALEWAADRGLATWAPEGRRGLQDTPPLPTEPSLVPQGQAILVLEATPLRFTGWVPPAQHSPCPSGSVSPHTHKLIPSSPHLVSLGQC